MAKVTEHKAATDWAQFLQDIAMHCRGVDKITLVMEIQSEVLTWQDHRDQLQAEVNWRFTTKDARIKRKRLYPTLEM